MSKIGRLVIKIQEITGKDPEEITPQDIEEVTNGQAN